MSPNEIFAPGSKAHHAENGFRNPDFQVERGLSDLLKWQWDTLGDTVENTTPDSYLPDIQLLQKPVANVQLTWIGHATFLIQLYGLNILTD